MITYSQLGGFEHMSFVACISPAETRSFCDLSVVYLELERRRKFFYGQVRTWVNREVWDQRVSGWKVTSMSLTGNKCVKIVFTHIFVKMDRCNSVREGTTIFVREWLPLYRLLKQLLPGWTNECVTLDIFVINCLCLLTLMIKPCKKTVVHGRLLYRI